MKLAIIVGSVFLGFFAIAFQLYSMSKMRNRGAKKGMVLDNGGDSGEYHNDFSKVPAATEMAPSKPIDLSGNVFEHNEETFAEDMRNIGIDPTKK